MRVTRAGKRTAPRRRENGELAILPEGRKSDLSRCFFGVAIGALAGVNCVLNVAGGVVDVLFHVVGGVVHVPLSATNPLTAGRDGSIERILRAARDLISRLFARLRSEQNSQCCAYADAHDERRNSFRPTHAFHKSSI